MAVEFLRGARSYWGYLDKRLQRPPRSQPYAVQKFTQGTILPFPMLSQDQNLILFQHAELFALIQALSFFNHYKSLGSPWTRPRSSTSPTPTSRPPTGTRENRLFNPDPTKCVRHVQFWTRRLNGRRRFGRRSVTTLRVSFRFMAQTALKPHLILDDDNSLD